MKVCLHNCEQGSALSAYFWRKEANKCRKQNLATLCGDKVSTQQTPKKSSTADVDFGKNRGTHPRRNILAMLNRCLEYQYAMSLAST